MHPQDPYQDPYRHQPPYPPQQYPPQPPAVFVQQQPNSKAATVGVWVLVAWFVGPVVLLLLCCAGCMFTGVLGSFVDGFSDGVSSTPSP